jgi:hypothetical protein
VAAFSDKATTWFPLFGVRAPAPDGKTVAPASPPTIEMHSIALRITMNSYVTAKDGWLEFPWGPRCGGLVAFVPLQYS